MASNKNKPIQKRSVILTDIVEEFKGKEKSLKKLKIMRAGSTK